MKLQSTLIGCAFLIATVFSQSAFGSTLSIGPNGIDSAGLTLANGAPMNGDSVGSVPKVAIGQVELTRPGKAVADGGNDLLANSSPSVVPTEVYVRTASGAGIANIATDDHAEEVASVIIGTDTVDPDGAGGPRTAPTGAALGVALYSAATNPPAPPYAFYDQDAAVTLNHIATLPGVDIRAINMSFGNPFDATHSQSDGNQLLTQFVDWSAADADILYVASGYEGNLNPVPKDNFNGITVAYSTVESGMYRRVAAGNNLSSDATGDRTSIGLLAPGDNVDMTALNSVAQNSGTSFAAPHVTATAALLYQYANERISAGAPGWNAVNSHRHEVMKAVLLNSADKLLQADIDNGTVIPPAGTRPIPAGGLLGMSRTIYKKAVPGGNQNPTWFDSAAYDDSIEGAGIQVPLDEEMGTGQLNARRARTQFAPGEYDPDGSDVPVVGWDYGTTTNGSHNTYRIAGDILGGSFISITLAWDRRVEFMSDSGTMGKYDAGDTFKEYVDDGVNPPDDKVINDLNIYLLPKFSATIQQSVALSDSIVGTVEYLFFQIPQTGEYEFWISQEDNDVGNTQNYGVAWWRALPANPPGDYNGDQVVDAQDYTVWRGAFGSSVTPGTGADGNGNGIIDSGDYIVWRKASAAGSGASLASVPEPSALALFTSHWQSRRLLAADDLKAISLARRHASASPCIALAIPAFRRAG